MRVAGFLEFGFRFCCANGVCKTVCECGFGFWRGLSWGFPGVFEGDVACLFPTIETEENSLWGYRGYSVSEVRLIGGLRGGCLGVGGGDATTWRGEFVLVSSSICCLFRF